MSSSGQLLIVAKKMSTPCIKAKSLSFSYGTHQVIENLSFVVERGDYLGIIGPNGGGKTTLVKIILGLLTPSSGEVLVEGKCGYVPQKAAQEMSGFPATALEVVTSSKNTSLEKIKEIISLTGIEEYQDHLVSTLSGGERQKVFIARALTSNPDILILDEPSTGVDVAAQAKFYSFLKELNEKGVTIIFISHDINVIAAQAKNVLCVGGKNTCFGPPQETITDKNIATLYGRDVKFFPHQH